MISKNSFLISMKENNKRRLGIWVISMLFWFFYFPVLSTMIISKESESYGADSMALDFYDLFSLSNGRQFIMISLFAIICAIQGFSFLYSKKKVDLYHSVPVTKARQFTTIYVNSIFIYVIPYCMNLLLAFLLAAGSGAMTMQTFKMAIFTLVCGVIFYLGMYSLTVIAVMLTGNLLITLCGTLVFLFYESGIIFLLSGCSATYFETYSSLTNNMNPLLSPAVEYLKLVEQTGIHNEPFRMGTAFLNTRGELFHMVLLALLFSTVAYMLYKKRPSESAEKPIAFTRSKAIIKVMITVPLSLAGGFMTKELYRTQEGEIMYIIGMIFTCIFCSCLLEVIFEQDIRAAFHKKKHILISAALTAFIYCIFVFDLIGYDRWMPNQAKLKDAVIDISAGFYQEYYDENFDYFYRDNRVTQVFEAGTAINDKELICEFTNERLSWKNTTEEDPLYCEVAYRMNNGKIIYRSFPISTKNKAFIQKMSADKNLKTYLCQIADENFYQRFKKLDDTAIVCQSEIGETELAGEHMDAVRACYLKDLENHDMTAYRNQEIIGILKFSGITMDENRIELPYYIYSFNENVIGYLKEKGLYDNMFLKPENIASISVSDLNQWTSEGEAAVQVFTEADQIEKLVEALCLTEFADNWDRGEIIADQYEITIRFKTDTEQFQYTNPDYYYCFIQNLIPDFVN